MTQDTEQAHDAGSETCEPDLTWREVMLPILRKFEVAQAAGMMASFNATGSGAVAKLIKDMTHRLDVVAPAAIRSRDERIEELVARNRALEAENAILMAAKKG